MGGGLFNQDPVLIERFQHIFQEQAAEEARKEAKEKADANRAMGPTHSPRSR